MHAHREGNASLGQDVLNFTDVLREGLSAGMIALDAQRRVTLFNTAAESITGLNGASVLNQAATALPAALCEALEAGEDGAREIKFSSPARGEVLAQLTLAHERSPDGRLVRVLAVLNDLTTVRAFGQTMRRLDRLASIGTLSAGMAHEIKNAMQAVKTFIEVLIQKKQDAQLGEVVNRELCRINAIVSQMLRFAGPAKPVFTTVNVHDVLEQSLDLVHHHLEGRKISLHRAMEARPDAVRGDSYQLEQVFLNLFFNALDAMGADGRLTIATEVVPTEQSALLGSPALRVCVKDSGIGIPPENLGRLFEPFFTTKPNGTGLGLPITQRIIQEHRGVISVSSKPGEGAAFDILLPLAVPVAGQGMAP